MVAALTVLSVVLVSSVGGEELASCSRTLCGAGKQCRIIERCWGQECRVGTACFAPENLAAESPDRQCTFDHPVLRSVDGGSAREIVCGSSSFLDKCPVGTTCIEPNGVCCTGETKNTGACPAVPQRGTFRRSGDCVIFCRHDQECPGFQKCCDNGLGCHTCVDPAPPSTCQPFPCSNGHHCVMAETECASYPCLAAPKCVQDKAGSCPLLNDLTPCTDQCQGDSHCPEDHKCCKTGGCKACLPPASSSTSTSSSSGAGGTPSLNSGFAGLLGVSNPLSNFISQDSSGGSASSGSDLVVTSGTQSMTAVLDRIRSAILTMRGSSSNTSTSSTSTTGPAMVLDLANNGGTSVFSRNALGGFTTGESSNSLSGLSNPMSTNTLSSPSASALDSPNSNSLNSPTPDQLSTLMDAVNTLRDNVSPLVNMLNVLKNSSSSSTTSSDINSNSGGSNNDVLTNLHHLEGSGGSGGPVVSVQAFQELGSPPSKRKPRRRFRCGMACMLLMRMIMT